MSLFEYIKAICKGPYHPICQDAIFFMENDKKLCAVVADGLGSRIKSDRGSKIIVRLVGRQLIKSSLGNDVINIEKSLNLAVNKWYKQIIAERGDFNDYSTTCSFVLIDKKQRTFSLGFIGDSPIFYQVDNRSVTVLKDDKEFSNLTDCIGLNPPERFKLFEGKYNNKFRVLVSSDGFGDDLDPLCLDILFEYLESKYSSWSSHKKSYHFKREISTSLNNINQDDKSAIFIWSKE